MIRTLERLWPQRITTQIVLLVVASLITAQVAIAIVMISLYPRPSLSMNPASYIGKLAYTAKLLSLPLRADESARILELASAELPGLVLGPLPERAKPSAGPLAAELRAQLGNNFSTFDISSEGSEERRLIIVLPHGSAISAPFPVSRGIAGTALPAIITIVVLAIAIALLSVWAARTLTAPLTRFADAAERFTLGSADAPLSERGPREIVRAARALNGMRERIRRMVEDRAQMLAAISHDLRTPITRLRLRAEEIEPMSLRTQVIRDLETMQAMSHAALSFLRDQATTGVHVQIDLASLAQTVCNDFEDTGHLVSFNGQHHVYVSGDPDQLGRAITNLVENGLKFGTRVSIVLERKEGLARLDVRDDGPGIIDGEKLRVMEPFYKSDGSRDLNKQDSFGLGLSIASAIAAAHHGKLSLHDAIPTGLIARLTLPLVDLPEGEGIKPPTHEEAA